MTSFAGSLDTNILLRLLLKDVIAQHKQAVDLLEDARGQLVVADAAIIEMSFVLDRYYKLTRYQVAEAVQAIMSLTRITCNRPLFTRVLPLYVEHRSLSFEDCYLAIYAELNNAIPLWTFDKKLATNAPNTKIMPK